MKNIIFILVIVLAFSCKKKDDPKPQPKSALLHISFQSANDSAVIKLSYNYTGSLIDKWHVTKTGGVYTFSKDTLITSGIYIEVDAFAANTSSQVSPFPLQSGTYLVAYYNGVKIDSITTYNENPGPPYQAADMGFSSQLPTLY